MEIHFLDKETEDLLQEILENDKNFPAILRDKFQGLNHEEDSRLRAKIKLLTDEGYISKLSWGDGVPLIGRIEQKGRAYFELKDKCAQYSPTINKGKIFISHSSKDIQFVNKLSQLLVLLGVNRNNIFCSSIEGQGVNHGKKIEEAVRNQIVENEILIYVISYNFMNSNYCLNELGAGWILTDKRTQGKEIFLIKLPDIKFEELKGFIGSTDKHTEINKDSISSFIDEFETLLQLPAKRLTEYNNIIDTFINDTKPILEATIQTSKEDKEKKEKEELEKLKKVLLGTTIPERNIIKKIYNSADGSVQLDDTNATVALMERKNIIVNFDTYIDIYSPHCSYTLQPWVHILLKEKDIYKKIIE